MASTFTAAFEAVQGPDLDLAAGYTKEALAPADVDAEVKEAFARFGGRAWRQMARQLARSWSLDVMDAEDAITDGLLKLWEQRPGLFKEDPESWCGLLYGYANNLLQMRRVEKQLQPVPLSEVTRGGDGDSDEFLDSLDWLNVRSLVAYTKAGVDEDARYVDPPTGIKEAWTWRQAIGAGQRFRDRHGRSPRIGDFDRAAENGLPAPAVLRRLGFDGLADFHLQAGLPVEARPRRRNWQALEAAEVCITFREREGHWPSSTDQARQPDRLPGRRSMKKFFGGCTALDVQLGSEAIMGGELPRHRRNWLPTQERRQRAAQAALKSAGGGASPAGGGLDRAS